MWLKRFLLVLLAVAFCLPVASAQDTSRETIISNQELIISIVRRLTESIDIRESILQRERASLADERQAFEQEKIDFENYKKSTQTNETDLQKLKDSLNKQSEQLAVLNKVVSWGVPIAIAIMIGEAVVIALK